MSKEETNYFSLSLVHSHIVESFLKGRGGEGEENTFYIEMKNTTEFSSETMQDNTVTSSKYSTTTKKKPFKNEDKKYFF